MIARSKVSAELYQKRTNKINNNITNNHTKEETTRERENKITEEERKEIETINILIFQMNELWK